MKKQVLCVGSVRQKVTKIATEWSNDLLSLWNIVDGSESGSMSQGSRFYMEDRTYNH